MKQQTDNTPDNKVGSRKMKNDIWEDFKQWLNDQDMKTIGDSTTNDIFIWFVDKWLNNPDNFSDVALVINEIENSRK